MKLRLDLNCENSREKFDIAKYIEWVPPVQEANIDKYFCTLRK